MNRLKRSDTFRFQKWRRDVIWISMCIASHYNHFDHIYFILAQHKWEQHCQRKLKQKNGLGTTTGRKTRASTAQQQDLGPTRSVSVPMPPAAIHALDLHQTFCREYTPEHRSDCQTDPLPLSAALRTTRRATALPPPTLATPGPANLSKIPGSF